MTSKVKVYGSPGCGKTHHLLGLLEKELKLTSPERVAFLTFTRSARAEALSRTGLTQDELPHLRTIHSACYQALGIQAGQVVKKKDLKYFGKQVGVKLGGGVADPWAAEEWAEPVAEISTIADSLLHLNHLGRHKQVGLLTALQDQWLDVEPKYAIWFTKAYRDWKTAENRYDYTDMLTEYLDRGEPLDIDAIFLDEAQDCSRLQWDVVRRLGANASRWYIAGDDDQSIFSWAGASPEAFIDEPCTEENFLTQSYRLPRQVLRKSQQLIHRIRRRIEKPIFPRDAEGQFREVGYLEPKLFGSGSCFVLFRNHFRGQALARQLEELRLPFSGTHSVLSDAQVHVGLTAWHKAIKGETLTQHEAKTLADYSDSSRLSENARSVRGEVQAPYLYRRFPTEQEWPTVLLKLPKIGYLSQLIKDHGWAQVLKPPTVLMSIHQSKGQQADQVLLDVAMARKSFDASFTNPDAECRVWYVALTRAKNNLFTLLPEDALTYQL